MSRCESWTIRKAEHEELMFLNCSVEDSWDSHGLQGDQTSQSYRKSTLNMHWKDWCRSSNILATWCEEPTLLEKTLLGKIEGRRRRGQQRMRWLDGIQFNGREFAQTPGDSEWQPGMLKSMGLQRIRHDWATAQKQWKIIAKLYAII